jgi:hypothetical protein
MVVDGVEEDEVKEGERQDDKAMYSYRGMESEW